MKNKHFDGFEQLMYQKNVDEYLSVFNSIVKDSRLCDIKRVKENPYVLLIITDEDNNVVPIKNENELVLAIDHLCVHFDENQKTEVLRIVKDGGIITQLNGPIVDISSVFYFLKTDVLPDYIN